MNDILIYPNESYQIIGACFEVYREKGCGFLEPVYQECLANEFVIPPFRVFRVFRSCPPLSAPSASSCLKKFPLVLLIPHFRKRIGPSARPS